MCALRGAGKGQKRIRRRLKGKATKHDDPFISICIISNSEPRRSAGHAFSTGLGAPLLADALYASPR